MIEKKQENILSIILDALIMLDKKGTNQDVTKAMTIVLEAFQQQSSDCRITSAELYQFAIDRQKA